jgi:small-conductance mechanosensitive channel
MDWIEVWDRTEAWLLASGLRILLILVLATAGWIGSRFLARKIATLLTWRNGEDAELKKRAQTIAAFFRYALLFAILITATIMISPAPASWASRSALARNRSCRT